MASAANVKIEPCAVYFDGTDLGLTDGDIEFNPGEQIADVLAHQTGTTVQDGIRTGFAPELSLVLKETTLAQVQAALTRAGATTSTAVAEVSTVETVADVASSLNNKYFTLRNGANALFHVWFDVNSAGADPAPAGSTGIEVDLGVGDTAAQVASAIQAAVDAHASFVATVSNTTVTITNAATGYADDIADVNTGFTFAVTTQGAPAGLIGYGSGQVGSNIADDAGHLILRPTRLVSAGTKTEDMNFWKAYPMIESISSSGENPRTVSVSFKILPDATRAAGHDLWALGNGS